MPGYNLWTYRRYMLELWTGARTNAASAQFPDAYIVAQLRRAFSEIGDMLRWDRRLNATTALVAGQAAYTLPAGALGRQVSLRVLTSDGGQSVVLPQIGVSEARELYDFTDFTAGEPACWCWSDTTPRGVYLLPPPDYSAAGGLLVTSTMDEHTFFRVWAPTTTTATAAIVYGALTATMSSVPVIVLLDGDYEFGLVQTTQFDGTALSSPQPPLRWYTATNVTDTTITLSEAFGEADVTAGQFILAQVHPIELAYPGKLHMLPAQLAASYEYETKQPELFNTLYTTARSLIEEKLNDEEDFDVRAASPSVTTFLQDQ